MLVISNDHFALGIGLSLFTTTTTMYILFILNDIFRMQTKKSSDDVHLQFLLGSVRARENSRRKSKKSKSTPGSRDSTIGPNHSPRAREKWYLAREAISKGYTTLLWMGVQWK